MARQLPPVYGVRAALAVEQSRVGGRAVAIRPHNGGNHSRHRFLGLPAGALLVSLSLQRNSAWSPVRTLLLVLAHLTWISRVLLIVTFILLVTSFMANYGALPDQAPPTLPHVIGLVGWADRLLVVADCAWVAAVAACAIRLRRQRLAFQRGLRDLADQIPGFHVRSWAFSALAGWPVRVRWATSSPCWQSLQLAVVLTALL